ncbi:MAG: NAD(P)H-hydrate dehydratase [Lachnospiraceae bacterium]|nr:NAD(P)H-hydrate dehydratase [Lachnospiraceae bacterium]
MRALVTGAQMKAIDRTAIQEIGIPSLVLMERAAMAVVEEVKKRTQSQDDIIWCACGCGNNGADGVAAARMLHLAGYPVVIVFIGDREKGSREFQLQASIAEKLGIGLIEYGEFIPGSCDVLVDAVFGVGLSRSVEGEYREFLQMLEDAAPRLTVAVDMPSGISSDNGQILGTALRADVTVTFGWEKLGTVLFPGREYAGQVVIADIGFPQMAFDLAQQGSPDAVRAFTFEPEDWKRLPVRRSYSNKGSFGKVLVVAGSKNMGGAAYLSALAAYRTGAGLVKILTVEENRSFLLTRLPEAILETYDADAFGEEPEDYRERFEQDCEWADAVVLGPGLGQEGYVRNLVEMILTAACTPVIVDADALNMIAANSYLTAYYTENIIITPHLGEMARLTGKSIHEIQKNLIPAAQEYASHYGITCILKDAATAAALRDGRIYINTSGNSAMAKAGSGDVLTGILAALLAQGMDEMEGTVLGIYLHGAAGDWYRKKKGAYSMLAGELADCVADVLEQAAGKAEG